MNLRKIGKYSKNTKAKYLQTPVKLDKNELVMHFDKGGKNIVNQIMQAWETPYMKRLAEIATSNGGKVLEVGFGMGISARFIQGAKQIERHIVIECHPHMIASAKKKFAKALKNNRMVIHEGFWEEVVKDLPDESFDGILFDSCPLDKEVEAFQFFPFFKEAFRLLKHDGIFTYFSDEPAEISAPHQKVLKDAKFKNIEFEICKIEPPQDCLYWKHKTIVAPIIKKH